MPAHCALFRRLPEALNAIYSVAGLILTRRRHSPGSGDRRSAQQPRRPVCDLGQIGSFTDIDIDEEDLLKIHALATGTHDRLSRDD